ncbi:MAG: hypothetical protein ACREU7_15725 [Burkholderiales bacterium]
MPPWATFLFSVWHVLLILLLAWLLLGVVRRLLRIFHKRMIASASDHEERKRIETLTRVFRYIASVVVSVITLMLLLSELGISIAPFSPQRGLRESLWASAHSRWSRIISPAW